MEVAVLGPLEVWHEGARLDLGTPKQRALVAALAMARGRAVSVDAIVDLLWGESPPPSVTTTLQAYVSGLRRVLEPGRQRRAPATVLVTVAPGYALQVPTADVDAHAFDTALHAAHRRLQPLAGWGPSPLDGAELAEVLDGPDGLDAALARWRGTPYGELGDGPQVGAERTRLEELRLMALEDRAAVGLALGRHASVAVDLEALTSAHPLRERLWALRAVALQRAGRQAEALDVLARVREVLDEELGLEPSPELRALQTALLRQDPELDWVPPRDAVVADAGPLAAVAGPVPPVPPVPEPPAAEREAVAPWPLVGRAGDLSFLHAALASAEAGVPSFAVLTGEPGIGKTRLTAELGAEARSRGARVLVGRCSQDDGAPPLWPWAGVLRELGSDLPAPSADHDEGGRFRAWEQVVRSVDDAAAEQLTVLVLDDLHWADTSTLRVLRLLAEWPLTGRLLVLLTWRSTSEVPQEAARQALQDLAESLARRHAVRLELGGLPPSAVAEVFAGVSGRELSPDQAGLLRERTDGNPFFLVEYARLAGARTDLHRLLDEQQPPTAVGEVLTRRVGRLPGETVALLRTAAVVGREFDTPTLGATAGVDEDDVLDLVEPALVAGLVREDGIDRFVFTHALVRDTLRGQLSRTRMARAHARAARALDGAAGRETEVARHWLAAGPSYAPQAWRAAEVAARQAFDLHAYEDAADLLEAALAALGDDPAAAARDRLRVLGALREAHRWAAQLPGLVETVEQAVAVAEEIGDVEAVARAASATVMGSLWRSAPPGQVNEVVVGALRRSLERLPPEDGELRCRVLLALAHESEGERETPEVRDLVDRGLAMARRLGDDRLVADACQVACVALPGAATTVDRVAWSAEARDLTEALGDRRGFVVSATLHSVELGALGEPARMRAAAQVARAAAQELRIGFGELVLDAAEVPWLAMAGRFEEAESLIDRIGATAARIQHTSGEEFVAASLLVTRLWQGRALEVVPILEGFDAILPVGPTIAVFCWRGGDRERARAVHASVRTGPSLEGSLGLMDTCHRAEMALHLGEPETGRRTHALLAPYAGHPCGAGSALSHGPVDAWLALAAAASGDRDRAARHADDALDLVERWEVPLAGDWLRGLRESHAF